MYGATGRSHSGNGLRVGVAGSVWTTGEADGMSTEGSIDTQVQVQAILFDTMVSVSASGHSIIHHLSNGPGRAKRLGSPATVCGSYSQKRLERRFIASSGKPGARAGVKCRDASAAQCTEFEDEGSKRREDEEAEAKNRSKKEEEDAKNKGPTRGKPWANTRLNGRVALNQSL